MRLMLTSPVFAAEHVATRDQTLHGIERLARRSGRSELAVAQTLLDADASRRRAATRWPACPATGCSAPAGRRWCARSACTNARRAPGAPLARRLALPVYLGALLLGTLGAGGLAAAAPRAPAAGAPLWLDAAGGAC